MGNSLSDEAILERGTYLKNIVNLKFPILDIGTKNDYTDYIDFITPDELSSNDIMRGFDSSLRAFVVFKAEIEYPNGIKKKTFTTFFQRYSDNQLLWHCCGHSGTNLMDTTGGANNQQIKMLYDLFSSGEYKIDKNILSQQKLNFNSDELSLNDNLEDLNYPVKVRLGYSN